MNKKAISIRLDQDVIHWLKSSNQKYQTYINYILRKEMFLRVEDMATKELEEVHNGYKK